ncbi:DUF4249 family protein [Rubrivirga marina]|nr:DUF4249 family protein [Rubrivirga marina]
MTRRPLLLALVVLAGCEVPLDPIEASDRVFSLSGYLDTSADTQWVRVEPLARTAGGDPAPIDAVVTLTDLGGGAEVVLEQRVRSFPSGPAHLFWTTADVAPGRTYRLDARRPDGAETTTEVELPAAGTFSVSLVTGPRVCPTVVEVSGAERVVDVQSRYVVLEEGVPVEYRFSHADTFRRQADGSIAASVYYADDARVMGLDPLLDPAFAGVLSSDVVAAVATEDWPDPTGLSLEAVLQIEGFGVEGGVGFVGGAVTERRPFTPGVLESGFGNLLPCTTTP